MLQAIDESKMKADLQSEDLKGYHAVEFPCSEPVRALDVTAVLVLPGAFWKLLHSP